MPAVFSSEYVKKLNGPNKKTASNKRELAEALRADIRTSGKRTAATAWS